MTTRSAKVEEAHLEEFGYSQTLARTMGVLRSTMVNVSTSSVTTAVFTLFAYGLLTGGTAFVWTWAIGFLVLLLVTIMFAELGSSMPIAGALYQWASRLVGPKYGYVTGWIYIAAQVAITAAVAYGIAPFVGSLFDATLTTGQTQLVAGGFIVVCTIINLLGVRVASTVVTIGAIAEVVAMIVLTAVLIFSINQPVDILVHSQGLPSGAAFLPVALATLLFGSWAYTGLEMTTAMAEETEDASKIIPRAAITSLTTTFAVGMVFLIVAVLAIPNLHAVLASSNPLQTIIEGSTSAGFYKAILAVVVVAVFVCTMSNQALTARVIFSLGRDGRLPFKNAVMHVPGSTKVPDVSTIVVGVLAIVLLLFTKAIATIAVASLTAIFVAYMLVIWGQLFQRMRGGWRPDAWSVGRSSMLINVLAAVLGTALTLNIAWPRGGSEIVWYNRWAGFLFIGAAVVLAGAYYVLGGAEARKAINSPLPGMKPQAPAASGQAPVAPARAL
ncbi:MAG: Amino acid permease [Chthonomonadaceae bacterium]|jgi:amino acid transporter|nr:Amino acid permease [Chthonomonadaceae bacterium]